MPVTKSSRSLIVVQSEVHAERNVRIFNRVGESQVNGSVVYRGFHQELIRDQPCRRACRRPNRAAKWSGPPELASTVSVYITVFPTLPSTPFIAWASAREQRRADGLQPVQPKNRDAPGDP